MSNWRILDFIRERLYSVVQHRLLASAVAALVAITVVVGVYFAVFAGDADSVDVRSALTPTPVVARASRSPRQTPIPSPTASPSAAATPAPTASSSIPESTAAPTPTPAPPPAPTPRPCPVSDTSFCDFVYAIDGFLAARELETLISLVLFNPYQCGTLVPDFEPLECQSQPSGTLLQVTDVCQYQSECGLATRESYSTFQANSLQRVRAIAYPEIPGTGVYPGSVGVVVSSSHQFFDVFLGARKTTDEWRIFITIGFYRDREPGGLIPADKYIPWPSP